MKGKQAGCPACGGPVTFQIGSSLVAVCPYCRSVVARGDKQLEDLGKVADLVDTESPLKIDLVGQYRGKRFRLVGRTQYKHAAGGVWDEWYAAFPGNRWGWLAEAQGRFYMTFALTKPQDPPLPPFAGLEIEQHLLLGNKQDFTVTEVGTATACAAEGEIPYRLEPNQRHDYADLYGTDAAFATLDYSGQEPMVYLGQEVTLDEIGISPSARGDDKAPRQISALQVACPQCGGQLTLVAPDKSERVSCPSCLSLLDVSQGNLKFLETLKPSEHHPLIPLGTVGTLSGVEYTVIGFMARSVKIEGTVYFWTEYLLYHPRAGFRWLVHSDQHWNFVRPVSAGAVSATRNAARYEGRDFKIFQRSRATVRHVLGEFYWKVTVGEQVNCADYIAPPDILSAEATPASVQQPAAKEISYSLGTYVPHATVEEAFGVERLPRGFGVAPNQPSPVDRRVYLAWLGFAVLLVMLDVLFSASLQDGADQGLFAVGLLLLSILPIGTAMYSVSFENSRWAGSQFGPNGGGDEDDE